MRVKSSWDGRMKIKIGQSHLPLDLRSPPHLDSAFRHTHRDLKLTESGGYPTAVIRQFTNFNKIGSNQISIVFQYKHNKRPKDWRRTGLNAPSPFGERIPIEFSVCDGQAVSRTRAHHSVGMVNDTRFFFFFFFFFVVKNSCGLCRLQCRRGNVIFRIGSSHSD